MKTLSIKQPWAELIVSGRKTIELRSWNTKFRGKFLVHASKNPDKEAMKKFGFKELPCGFILGEVELVDVKDYAVTKDFDNDNHLADASFGGYGFVLENFKRFEEPICVNGRLGFWEFDKK